MEMQVLDDPPIDCQIFSMSQALLLEKDRVTTILNHVRTVSLALAENTAFASLRGGELKTVDKNFGQLLY